MSRWIWVTAFFIAISALVGAQGPTSRTAADQSRNLTRNRDLLRATIDNSLELGSKDGHLDKAGTCNRLVKIWAGEVERAAKGSEVARAVELGDHLNRVVEHGVAGNLRSARKVIEVGSPMEQQLFDRRDEVLNVLRPLESALGDAARDHRDLNALVAALRQVRSNVEDSTRK